MKKRTITLVICLVMSCFLNLAKAQNQLLSEKAFIEVTGVAEQRVVPNQIYVSITLKERQEAKVKITIEQQIKELRKVIQSLGIDLKNLQFTRQNAQYVRIRRSKKDLIAKATYLVELDNAKTVGNLFDKLDELKIKDAYISKVSHSKITDFKRETRILAIKAAKQKAQYLLQAIDEELGKPMKILENSNSGGANYNLNAISNMFVAEGLEKDDDEIKFKKITIRSSIYVKFAIK